MATLTKVPKAATRRWQRAWDEFWRIIESDGACSPDEQTLANAITAALNEYEKRDAAAGRKE